MICSNQSCASCHACPSHLGQSVLQRPWHRHTNCRPHRPVMPPLAIFTGEGGTIACVLISVARRPAVSANGIQRYAGPGSTPRASQIPLLRQPHEANRKLICIRWQARSISRFWPRCRAASHPTAGRRTLPRAAEPHEVDRAPSTTPALHDTNYTPLQFTP